MPEFVTGYSLRAPNANNVQEFFEALRDKTDLTSPSRRYPIAYLDLPPRAGTLPNIDVFDNEFFKFNINQTDKMDIVIRLILEVTQEALLDAKISIPALRGTRTGVYVGHCFSDYLNRQSGCDVEKTGYELVNGAHSMAANKISFFYDLKGPSMVFDTACSSSLVALHQARQDLKAGIVDRAIVGGASLTLDPNKNDIFNAYSMLSPDGRCYSFDARANGYCRSEGIAVVILESDRVCSHGYAKVCGSSVNNDGYTSKGITFPSSIAQAQNALDAFSTADSIKDAVGVGMNVGDIGYVEAHGTGTVAGDAQELAGLYRVLYGSDYLPHPLPAIATAENDDASTAAASSAMTGSVVAPRGIPIGSVKSNMGHAEGASGLMSLIKCLLMYEHKVLLPNCNYESTSHNAILEGYFDVVADLTAWPKPTAVCVSNYGFGGTNAFVIMQPGNLTIVDAADCTQSKSLPYCCAEFPAPLLSFKPEFGSLPATDLIAAAIVSEVSTSEYEQSNQDYRPSVRTTADLHWLQEQVALGNDVMYSYRDGRKCARQYSKIALVFSGQGSQWRGMGKALMTSTDKENIFRDTIIRLDAYCRAMDPTVTLYDWYMEEDSSSSSSNSNNNNDDAAVGWMRKQCSGIGITSYQIALINILKECYPELFAATGSGSGDGMMLSPCYFLGHSLGEVAAGYACGMQTEQQTIEIAMIRSELSSNIRPGMFILQTTANHWQQTCGSNNEDHNIYPMKSVHNSELQQQYHYYYIKDPSQLTLEAATTTDRLFDLTGSMVAVGLPASVIQQAIDTLQLKETCVACYNSPAGQTVSGSAIEIQQLKEYLLKQHHRNNNNTGGAALFWKDIDTDQVAYHAPHLMCHYDYLAAKFSNVLGTTAGSSLQSLPSSFLCTSVNPTILSTTSLVLDGHFHARNIVNAVYFQQALDRLPADTLVIEIGPHQGLLGQIKRCRSDVGTLGLIKMGQPLSEIQTASELAKILWAAGYNRHVSLLSDNNNSNRNAAATVAVLRSSRLSLNKRHPNLWNHSRVQKTYDYSDFEFNKPSNCKDNNNSSSSMVIYDLSADHAFLRDHIIQGQPLFPATGHIYTLWSTVGLDKAIHVTDLEILQAVPLLEPPYHSPEEAKLVFHVQQTGPQCYGIMRDGVLVARATVVVTTNSASSMALELPEQQTSNDEKLHRRFLLEQNALYNHFKRYGYDYSTAFKLVQHRTLPGSKCTFPTTATTANSSYNGFAKLLPAVHVIAWLDVMLQLFLEDIRMLRLPTLLRRIQLHPALLQSVMQTTGSTVYIDTATKRLVSPHAMFQELHTLPATKTKAPCKLIHTVQQFVSLGDHELVDSNTPAITEVASKWMTRQLMDYAQHHPTELTKMPKLQNVLKHIQTKYGNEEVGFDENATRSVLSSNPVGRMALQAYSDLPSLLTDPVQVIEAQQLDDILTPSIILQQCVALVVQEWQHNTTGLRVLDANVGTGSLTRRLWPLLTDSHLLHPLASYAGINVATNAVLGDSIQQDARFQSLQHDISSQPLTTEAEDTNDSKYHLLCAHNILHSTGDITATMRHLIVQILPGAYLLLEEIIAPEFSLLLWGISEQLKSNSMTWKQWQAVIADVPELEIVLSYRSDVRLTLLLRKRLTTNTHDSIDIVNLYNWEDIDPTASSLQQQQRFVSHGALSMYRTLVQEYIGCSLFTCTLSSNINDNDNHALAVALKENVTLRHVAWHNNQLGVWLSCSPSSYSKIDKATAMCLSIQRPGDLSTLSWVPMPSPSTISASDNTTSILLRHVSVEYAGLNFKDVMYAFGKLRLETPSFGLEVSGYDQQGRAVMGIGRSNCIATSTVLDMTWVIPQSSTATITATDDNSSSIAKTNDMTLAEAATVPVVYLTALYAMFEKARLQSGQSILIHGGAGGVGHAAIQLAQRRGIIVFTTCSDDRKRRHLKEFFHLDDAHIGNSRDLSFVNLVLRGTEGQGVDAVLNSLSGAALQASLTVVKDFGHFCEIGKYDLQTNTQIGLKVFERNVSYHAIDLATMFAHATYSKILQGLLQDALDRGDVRPLPYEVFPTDAVADGLRYLSAGKHVGKVLIQMKDSAAATTSESTSSTTTTSPAVLLSPATVTSPRFVTSGTHIITGGLGGFGMELAHWLVGCGAQRIVLTSRSGLPLSTGWQQMRYEALNKMVRGKCCATSPIGSWLEEVIVSTADVGDVTQCNALVDQYSATLKGVWHVAMVLEDMTFAKQTATAWNAVHHAKYIGCKNLDSATRNNKSMLSLDAFVVFSSVVALHGNIGQAAYGHANAACESVVHERNAAAGSGGNGCVGGDAVAIQWGAIDNVGFVSQHGGDMKNLISHYSLQNIDDSLDCLHKWVQYRGVVSSYCASDVVSANSGTGGTGSTLVSTLEDVQAKFASVLGGKGKDYDPDTAIHTYGLDSLSTTVLVNWMNSQQLVQAGSGGNSNKPVTVEFFNDNTMTLMKMFAYIQSRQQQHKKD